MKSHLKTSVTHISDVIDMSTGEVVDTKIVHNKYLVNTKEEFYLLYASAVINIMKDCKDINIALFAALVAKYANGQGFGFSKGFKEDLAKEIECSVRSLDNAITYLRRNKYIIRLSHNYYKLNPRHVFKGSSNERNVALKAVLELECPNC